MTSPTDSPTDDLLATYAEDFLDAILSAADVATIGVSNWWSRATTALTTAAARAMSVRDMVTVTTSKLQVETLPERATREVIRLETALVDPDVFQRWRRLCERDAVYVAAMVRLRRADRRNTKKQSTEPAITTAPKDAMF